MPVAPIALAVAVLLSQSQKPVVNTLSAAEMANKQAVVRTTLGTFVIDLQPDLAPNHVGYFIKLARSGAYDGTTFHRVIRHGIIQGGDPLSKDPAKVSDFYAKIFDWKVQHMPALNYRVVDTGGEGGINGGILKPEREGPWPGNMLFYVLVDDLAAYRKKVVAAGGKIHVEEQKVPGMGKLSLFTDPEGRMMGLWKAKSK